MPRASCTRRPGDTASRRRGRGTPIARTLLPAVRRPPSPGEEPRSSRLPHLPRCKRRWRWYTSTPSKPSQFCGACGMSKVHLNRNDNKKAPRR